MNASLVNWCAHFVSVVLVLGHAASATAQTPAGVPLDFAVGLQIVTTSAEPIQLVPLDERIYRGVHFPDLRDLRIFNSQNQIVPHEIRRPQVVRDIQSHQQLIPIFPMVHGPAVPQHAGQVQIQESAPGKILSVTYSSPPGSSNPETLSYLADVRRFDTPVKELEFTWKAADTTRIYSTTIEASNDLSSWQRLATDKPLARLSYEGQELTQQRIVLPAASFKFLKIQIAAPADFELNSVFGVFTTEKKQAPGFLSQVADGRSFRDSAHPLRRGFDYDLGGFFPVEQIELKHQVQNSAIQFRLLSKNRETDAWRVVSQGRSFQMLVGEQLVASSPLVISENSDRFWRVELLGSEIEVAAAPTLLASWRPHEVAFLSSGSGPYFIAFGNASAAPANFGVGSLFSMVREGTAPSGLQFGTATLGQAVELGGLSRLSVPADKNVTFQVWKKWSLWALLILVALAMSKMALGLQRELNEKKES